MATSGPGATNLVTGIADAQIDSTHGASQVKWRLIYWAPMLFKKLRRLNSTSVTKWNYQITRSKSSILAKAFFIARDPDVRPVLIDITKDAQIDFFDFEYVPCTGIRSYQSDFPIAQDALSQAATLINAAKKPLIVWGQGVILGEAEVAFKAFVEKSLWRGLF